MDRTADNVRSGVALAPEDSERRPALSLREWTVRILMLTVSLVVGAGICEIALRIAPAHAGHRETAVQARRAAPPGQLLIRGRPLVQGAVPEGFRILVVGDSFTWGPGLYPEDTFPYRLQRRLDEQLPEVRSVVASLSQPGWNTETELQETKRHLAAFAPDLVILGFVLNDPEPSDRRRVLRMQKDLHRHVPQDGLDRLMYDHSRLFHTVYDRLENTRQRHRFSAYYHGLYADGAVWTACLTALHGFRRLADENSFEILLAVFPIFDSQLDAEYPYRDLHELMQRLGQRLDLPVLDLLPAYEGIDARRLALEPFTDPHPGELAHRIAADQILRYMLDHRLVPVPEPAETR